ncbi:MAG TPA: hypothetical protein VER37_11525, partial [Thermomicrobiales bacterium]|nr:hypothetical protein [Thermomicrobiales bacterium]
MAEAAFDIDGAAVHLDQSPCDRQTETGTTVPASGAGIGLPKLVEDERHDLRVDPDPGIADGQLDRPRYGAADDGNPAAVGELHRVADKVEQDLVEALRVGRDRWQSRLEIDDEVDPSIRDLRRQIHSDLGDHIIQTNALREDAEPPGLDPGQIEDVVDKRQQAVGRCRDPIYIAVLL